MPDDVGELGDRGMVREGDVEPWWEPSRARFLVPNALSLSRLGLGLLFPMLPGDWRLPAFLASAATEALDGTLARLLHATSTFGRVLDPIADKTFVLAVLVTLAADGVMAWWMLPLIAARDILVLGGGIWVAIRHGPAGLVRMPPTPLGKLTTGAQFLLLLALLARPVLGWGPPIVPLLAATAALSLATGIDYLRRFEGHRVT